MVLQLQNRSVSTITHFLIVFKHFFQVINIEDAARSTKLLAQTTLRNILGTKTLTEMLSDRDVISLQMQV